MVEIDVSEKERFSGRMSREHRDAAVEAVHRDGLIVLNGVVETAHLDLLGAKMEKDVERILELDRPPYQFVVGHVQQDPPPFEPYLFGDVLHNDMVVEVTRAVLGDGVTNCFYSGNTNLPGSGHQPVHVDSGQLWPELEQAHPPCRLVINISPIEMGPENGSTELWLGTHLDTTKSVQDPDIKVLPERLEARRAKIPPIQPRVRKGAAIIRDMRLWHRGMPNASSSPRPMIAQIHTSAWLQNRPMRFPKGTEGCFEHPHLVSLVEFVKGIPDYLGRHKPYDFHG